MKKQPGDGEHAGEKGRGGAKKRKKLRGAARHGKQEIAGGARVYPERESKLILPLLPLGVLATCKARWMWAVEVIFPSATCSLQFAKSSAATLSQQEKNNSAEVQRGGFIPRGDIPSTSSGRWPIASRRARHRQRLFELVIPPAPAAQNLGAGLQRPCRGIPNIF
jgi:hypothetical protein